MLVHEKADQAQALLGETDLDCWLIFARETGVRPDPGVELVVGSDVTWNSAFLFGVAASASRSSAATMRRRSAPAACSAR